MVDQSAGERFEHWYLGFEFLSDFVLRISSFTTFGGAPETGEAANHHESPRL
jgi:hypothetical protein